MEVSATVEERLAYRTTPSRSTKKTWVGAFSSMFSKRAESSAPNRLPLCRSSIVVTADPSVEGTNGETSWETVRTTISSSSSSTRVDSR